MTESWEIPIFKELAEEINGSSDKDREVQRSER